MAFQITDLAQLAKFNRLWAEVNLVMSKGGQNPEIGLFSKLYEHVADITTELTVGTSPGDVTSGPQPGVSINSWLWISGAKTVNNNEGFNGQFIQKFTQEQHFQRTGKQLSDDDAQIASNNVAYNFFEDIALRIERNAPNHIPTMGEIAIHDAGAAAKVVFNELPGGGEFAPWAGTLLFPYLGHDDVFEDWLITNKKVVGEVENNQGLTETLTFSVVEG